MLCATALIPIKIPASSVSKDPKASLMLEALESRAQKSAKVEKWGARHILSLKHAICGINIFPFLPHFLLHSSHIRYAFPKLQHISPMTSSFKSRAKCRTWRVRRHSKTHVD